MTKKQKAQTFWNWFSQAKNKYLFIKDVNEKERDKLMGEFISELHKYDEHIFFEMGGRPGEKKMELIITAEGIKEHFQSVEYLVENAPEFEDWEVIAFKPPMGTGFTARYQGYEFDPEKTIFIPLYSEAEPDSVGIMVCYPEYTEKERSTFLKGTYLMLDVILGEKSTTLDIDYLEVGETPADIGEYPFRHLSEIREFIKEVKNS